jgi:anti-anti-sigma factor
MNQFRIEAGHGASGERIIKLSGPFTLRDVFDFQTLVRSEPPAVTILDMSEVPYMDSGALGSLLGMHVSCQRDGRHYGIVGICERLQTMFRVAGVNGILVNFDTLSAAQGALTARAHSV